MKTRRTAWWQYVIGAVLGLLAGIGLASYGESSGLSLIGAPWIVTGLLAVLGVIVLICMAAGANFLGTLLGIFLIVFGIITIVQWFSGKK